MSLKNLGDSVYQSGHMGRCSAEHKQDLRSVRHRTRQILRTIDGKEEHFLLPKMEQNYPVGGKRMLLVREWMEQQVGQPWLDVETWLNNRFGNRRSYASQRAWEQISGWVTLSASLYAQQRSDFYVDEQGILQDSFELMKETWLQSPRPHVSDSEIEDWAKERRVGFLKGEARWCEPIAWKRRVWKWCPGKFYAYDTPTHFALQQPLNDEELELYHSLNGRQLRKIRIKPKRRNRHDHIKTETFLIVEA